MRLRQNSSQKQQLALPICVTLSYFWVLLLETPRNTARQFCGRHCLKFTNLDEFMQPVPEFGISSREGDPNDLFQSLPRVPAPFWSW